MEQNTLKRRVHRAAVVAGLALSATGAVTTLTAAPTTVLAASATGEYQITDSSYYLGDYLKSGLGDATVVKLNTYSIQMGSTVIPAQVKQLVGWDQNTFFKPEGEETVRTIGYKKQTSHTLTWEKGSTCEVRSITFDLVEDKLTVPAGTTVTFKNCTFNDRIVVEKGGRATFENCTFKTGTIKNNGQASYAGSTKEPKNVGKAEVAFQDLAVRAAESKLADAMHNHAYGREVALNVTGTNAAAAKLSAKVEGEDLGISAKVEDGKLVLSGTPTAAGTVTVKVTATADDAEGKPQTSEDTVSIEVSQEYKLVLEGSFDPIRLTQSYNDTNYRGGMTVFVQDEAGTKTSLNEWPSDDYTFELTGLPTGAGYNVVNAGGSYHVGLTGTPEEAGSYELQATLAYHGATIEAEPVSLRVYPQYVSLAEALKTVEGTPESWDMEPFELFTSGNAVVPIWLKAIYGSHESGLYGQIGNAEDAYASDTLTIPAGADVELTNIKVNSSVKVVVERGAKLTLTDSVVFGEIEVDGGTLQVTPQRLDEDGKAEVGTSGFCGTLTLNDGSVLANSQIVNNADFLTDGRYAEIPAQAVMVNGTVTFVGENSIESAEGQVALTVKGTAVVPAGSTLTATSTEMSTVDAAGGAAVKLEGGVVKGDGTLVARGADSGLASQVAGKAVVGTGQVLTKGFVAQGGTPGGFSGVVMDGADAGEKGVVLDASRVVGYDIKGGSGLNGGADGLGVESFTVKDLSGEESGSDETPGTEQGGQAGTTDKAGTTSTKKKASARATLPKTGDASAVAGLVVASGAALSALGAALKRRR